MIISIVCFCAQILCDIIVKVHAIYNIHCFKYYVVALNHFLEVMFHHIYFKPLDDYNT